MGIKELSLELAAVTMIEQEAKRAKDALRARLKAEMDAIGADRVKADIDGSQVAYVTTSSLSSSGTLNQSDSLSNG